MYWSKRFKINPETFKNFWCGEICKMEKPILKVISDTETKIVTRGENGLTQKTYKTKPYPGTQLTPLEKLNAELGELPEGSIFYGSGLFNIKPGSFGNRGEDLKDYNWVEILQGEIRACAQGDGYAGCYCRFWDSHCDSREREYCIKSLAAKMTEEDKISVLCALRNTKEWYRRVRPSIKVMNWIQLTPETMPPDMVIVMVTVRDNGIKKVVRDIAYSHKEQKWFWYDAVETQDFYQFDLDLNGVITHWMPYPDPAED